MPELHIAEEPIDDRAQEEAKAEVLAAELEETARYAEWLLTQNDVFQALAAEWASMRGSRLKLETVKNRNGLFYVVSCDHGIHMSRQSPEHALFLLVDSHRTRVEDTAEFRERVKAANAGMTDKEALRRCEQIQRQIREANPKATGEERDALAMAHLESIEAAAAAPFIAVDGTETER